jgi:L-malate glycosyltransferase
MMAQKENRTLSYLAGRVDRLGHPVTDAELRRKAAGVHVLLAIPVLLVGGTEMQTLQLVRVLAGAGYRVSVCCFFGHDPVMLAAMRDAGATVQLLGADPSVGLIRLLLRLVVFFRRQRPDIVHVQYLAPGWTAVLAARLALTRTVFATVHQPGRPYGPTARLLLRSAARMCTAFFCNSLAVERSWFGDSALLDTHLATGGRHATIYNMVEVERISLAAGSADRSALRAELGLGDGPVVGCIGRLRVEKGQGVLLEAMGQVLRKYPCARLLMVGDGPDRVPLEQKADLLGIAGQVVWLGMRDAACVFRLLPVLDLAVVPSHFEGFGLAAAEAMAAGLPVVASDADGLAEVVEQGETGLLVPPGDARALASAIETLLADAHMRAVFGANGLTRVRRKFSAETFAQATLAAYRQLAGTP